MTLCLIVDDSPTIRKIARQMLEDYGFQCAEVDNGKEAHEVCGVLMPEMILLDWNMPVMTGIEFLQLLRSMEFGHYPKVLFCTTENSLDFIQRAMDAGADEYIMKPFDKAILASKLEQLGLIGEGEALTGEAP